MSNTALTLQIGGDISKLRAEMNKANGLMGGFQKQMLNIGKMMAGALTADAIIGLGKSVFNVTAEFQKFEAVLTNTLGSNSAAKAALGEIADFAAKTPFQVNELTESFVKLANQGFIPTMRQMTSLGDLASAMGKSFNQLTEAIIDAQTGEFERLKEFGIRASKEGDKVSFTFKGVKTQVDFTADSIRQYILSLGQAEGVTGGMAKQSETLGGRLSNLKDSWDQLMVAIGTSAESGGALSKGLETLTEMVTAIKGMFDPVERLKQELKFFTKLRQEAGEKNDIEDWVHWNTRMIETQTKLNELTEDAKKGELELKQIREDAAAAAQKAADEEERRARAGLQRSINGASGLTTTVTKQTGFDFMFDSGAMVEMANSGANALRTLDGALKINSTSWDEWWSGVQVRNQLANEDFQKFTENANRLAEEAQFIGESIGGVFEAIVSGQGNVIQAMIRATEQIVTMFLKQSIAAMIASHLQDPKTAAFPWAKVAAATAGIGIVKGLFAGLSGGMGGMSGGGGQVGVRPSEMNLNVSSRSRISGYHLELISEKESYRRSRVG